MEVALKVVEREEVWVQFVGVVVEGVWLWWGHELRWGSGCWGRFCPWWVFCGGIILRGGIVRRMEFEMKLQLAKDELMLA